MKMEFTQKMKKEADSLFRHRTKRRITAMLAVITLAVWIVTMVIKYIFSVQFGYDFSFLDILDGVLDNLLGVLPPIIIFNFIYEDLMQDLQADELSEQITQTLMGNQDSMKLFDRESKTNFLHTTMVSLLEEEKGNMLFEMIDPYLTGKYNIRKHYDYIIKLKKCPMGDAIFTSNEYVVLEEDFQYKKCFVNKEGKIGKVFSIGYFLNEEDLDEELKKESYIFREDLNVHKKDIEALAQLSDEEKLAFVENFMKLQVCTAGIDESMAQIATMEQVKIDSNGIYIQFIRNDIGVEENELFVDIRFIMPQVNTRSKFMAAISDPTLSPSIQFIYEEEMAEVIMIPFLNMSTEVRKTNPIQGVYRISLQDEWLMPMSGIVFMIEIKEEHLQGIVF
ncbi:MAG: hypothetical protein R3Y54_04415 [Eubacteriales bacterium]